MYQLSDYELGQLHAIDPRLNNDWQNIITATLPKLDKDSRQMVMEKILKPKGLYYNSAENRLIVQPAPSLSEVCKANPTDNKQLLKAIEQMLEFTKSPPIILMIILMSMLMMPTSMFNLKSMMPYCLLMK